MTFEGSRFLRRLPTWALLLLASCVKAKVLPLAPFPGWTFGIFEKNLEHLPTLVSLRRQIAVICAERRLRRPIRYRWHEGLKLHLYLGNDISRPLFVGGCIEPNELAFTGSFLEPGMVMIDVGANEGLFTLLGARRVGGSGRVYAFEPSDNECARLEANLRLNRFRNVQVIRKAVADQAGTAQLQLAGYGHEGQNTLGNFVYDVGLAGVRKVAVCRLDDFVAEQKLARVDFIKIDVEGAEAKVLRGAMDLLCRFRPVLLLELIDESLRHQGSCATEVIALLRGLGYCLYSFSGITGCPEPAEGPVFSSNIVAAPPGVVVRKL